MTKPDTIENDQENYGVVTEAGTVRFERLLPGPIERVWEYITDSEKRSRWLAPGPMQLQPGSRFELVFNNAKLSPHSSYKESDNFTLPCKIAQCNAPHRLSFIWNPGGDNESEVTIELSEQGEQVLLVLTHRHANNPQFMLSISAGWHTHLIYLADVLTGKTPGVFSTLHNRLKEQYLKILR